MWPHYVKLLIMKTYNKRLYKSDENKVIAGVMGGLGEYFDIDPVIFRVAYTGFSVFTAFVPGIIAYLLMALVMPSRPNVRIEKVEVKE